MKTRLICILFLVLMPIAFTQAEEDPLAPWEIVQRCLPAPIVPDENWTFDGEILMKGWGGIHAVNAVSDTPRVVHWGDGVLSPNGEWVLDQEVVYYVDPHLGIGGSMASFIFDYGDIVASNLLTGEKLTFPWEAHLDINSGPYPFGPAGPLWLDNNSFVSFYDWGGGDFKVGNLETGEITDWEGIKTADHELSISPDQTRAIAYNQLYDLADNSLIQGDYRGNIPDYFRAVWANDSSVFVDVTYDETSRTSYAAIFDRDANLTALPFSAHIGSINLGSWSPENEYFSITRGVRLEDQTLQFRPQIIDMRAKVVYDLCVDYVSGWAWSPDGSQFATILGSGQSPIVVVDMEQWQPYIVAYHTGSVLFWRDD